MEHSILKLEASAGSGKTYRLALEYIGRLLQMFAALDKKPENFKARQKALGSILAITFTVKAAQEMKSRIVEKLKSFALSTTGRQMSAADHEFLKELAQATGLAENKIIVISGRLIETILASYDDFNVKTIDSLMSAMIKVIAPDLELPAAYEIAIDAGNELAMRAKALLADLADKQWPRLEKTLLAFKKLNANNSWKPDEALAQKIIDLFHLNLRQGIMIEDIASVELEGRLNSHQDDFKINLKNLLLILTEEPKDEYKNINVKGNIVKETLLESMGDFLQTGTDLFKLEKLLVKPFFHKAAANELLKKNTPAAYEEKLSAAYEQLRPCLQKLAMDLSIFKTLPYREFFPDFVQAWNAGKETLFVEEFSRTLAERFAVWQADAFPYLYLKMSDRFSHFLFDEFQDTSTLQFKALAPLIDEVLSGREKASLFIVGDRKQAIYRWRGGNSELMDESVLKTEIPAITNLAPEGFSASLDKNWRSRNEIVDFNNSFWAADTIAQIAAEPDLQQAIAANFLNSRQTCPADRETAGGYVELSLLDEQEETAGSAEHDDESDGESNGAMSRLQLHEILKIIARLKEHGYEYSDIAILVRKNDQIRAIISHLSKNGIGSVSDQSLLLSANPRSNEIIAFLAFLDYPPDNLNFHAFISGAIFQAAAREKFSGQIESFSDEVFINCQGPFYKLFQEKYPDCWAGLIAPFFKAVGFLPPYDLFSDFCQVFRIYENFPGDTPFFMSLGDVLHRSERQEGNSIAGFLHSWKKILENEEAPTVAIPENSPGIRVLTMHQSKGLEFPAVIVPLNDSREKNPDPLHWDKGQHKLSTDFGCSHYDSNQLCKPLESYSETIPAGGESDLSVPQGQLKSFADLGESDLSVPQGRLFYIKSDLAQVQPDLQDIYQRENIKSSIDLLNLLYVAFTRAKEALFVPVAVKKLSAGTDVEKSALGKRITKASTVVSRHPNLTWPDGEQSRQASFGKLGEKATRQSPEKKPAACPAIPSKKVMTRSWQKEYLVFDKAPIGKHLDRKSTERGDRIHHLLCRLGDCSSREQLAARLRELAENEQWPASDIAVVSSYLCRADVFGLLYCGQEVHCEKEVVDNSGAIAIFQRLDRLQIGAEEVLVIDFKTGKETTVDHETQIKKYLTAITPLFPGKKYRGFLLYIDRGEVQEVSC